MSQVVDTESAKEFMREALDKVAPEDLVQICREVEHKSRVFRSALDREALAEMGDSQFISILRSVFATRRRAEAILKQFPLEQLRAWTAALLYGPEPVKDRFQQFVSRLEPLDGSVRRDLAGELLHFTDPDRYWLWTRWMWDPKTRTGALPLVTHSAYDLRGGSDGDTYLRVGEAVAFVHQVGEAAGFQTISRSIFGTDVFLSCVYVVYVYTVLRMRMTQEFNKVMPELPEFARRLLGVYQGVDPEGGPSVSARAAPRPVGSDGGR
ncbi:MAG: hypothetical protein HYX74_05235 [Acidobacteria bacterium]|nr:hypothetical protein [Acidobacteriota bacterium]